MISLSIVWYEQCSLTGLSASSLISSSPLTSSLYILDFDVLVCLLRSLYLLHPTSSFDFLFGVFLFLHLFCLPFAGCFLLMVAYFSQSSLAVAFLKTDLVSVLFLQILSVRPVRLLPHFVLPLISFVYLVPHPCLRF